MVIRKFHKVHQGVIFQNEGEFITSWAPIGDAWSDTQVHLERHLSGDTQQHHGEEQWGLCTREDDGTGEGELSGSGTKLRPLQTTGPLGIQGKRRKSSMHNSTALSFKASATCCPPTLLTRVASRNQHMRGRKPPPCPLSVPS